MFTRQVASGLRLARKSSARAGSRVRTRLIELLEERTVLDASLQMIHNSPYDIIGTLDVYVDDVLTVDNFAFQTARPFVSMTPGNHLIEFTDSDAPDSTSPFFSTTVNLADNTSYVAMIEGNPEIPPGPAALNLALSPLGRQFAQNPANVEMLFFNGVPDTAPIDVVARGGPTLVDDLAFPNFAADYVSVAPLAYTLDVTSADGALGVRSFTANLAPAAGTAFVVAVSDWVNPPPGAFGNPRFALLAVFPDGSAFVLPELPPTVSVSSVSANEGNAGTTPFVFTVGLSAPSSQAVTVAYGTSNGSATAGSDYAATSGTLTFAPGVTTQLVTVQVTGDTTTEPDEVFTVTLSGPTNATLGTASGSGTIQNDDTSSAVINFPSGFSGAAAQFAFNGTSANIVGTNLRVTDAGTYRATSSYFRTPVSVSSFNTHFDFQLLPGTNPIGDGFTFVIQGNGLTSLGANGGGLGYAGIGRSVAVKFDVYSNSGEGTNSTGQYANGAQPTTQGSVNLNGTGIDLRSGHVFGVDMTYNGTILTVIITDRTTLATATRNYTVNIPSIVGASTAYVGFTGGTGVRTAVQNILNWTYTAGTAVPTPSVAISGASANEGNAGTTPFVFTVNLSSASAQQVTVAYATANGTATAGSDFAALSGTLTFAPGVTVQLVTVQVSGDTTSEANETFSVNLSSPVNATLGTATGTGTILNDDSAGASAINFPSGFRGAASQFRFNGSSATISGTNLQLTNARNQAASAYFLTPVNVTTFDTNFDFQIQPGSNPWGDGFTFVIQGNGLTSLGSSGSALGYAGIGRSVAVKFDIYNNAGEGSNSTGLYTNGSSPTSRNSINLNGTGIGLTSGHVFGVAMTYSGTTLTVTITDRTTLASATQNYTVNIPSIVGTSTAYVGFTGGTGSKTSIPQIRTWVFTPGAGAAPTVTPLAAPAGMPQATTAIAEVRESIDKKIYTSSQASAASAATAGGATTATNNSRLTVAATTPASASADDTDLCQQLDEDLVELMAKSCRTVARARAAGKV